MYTGHASNTEILRVRSSTYSDKYLYIGGWSTTNSNNISRIRTSGNLHIDSPANGDMYLNHYSGSTIRLGKAGTTVYAAGTNTVWHSGNDGSGSGLDSDLLDGQEGSYYRNASNINAGTLSSSRIPTLSQYVRSDTNDVVAGRLEFSTTISKVIDFTDNSSDTGRGIYLSLIHI